MNPSTFYTFDLATELYTFGSHLDLDQEFALSGVCSAAAGNPK
jgi:hypothetical protein